MNRGFSSFVKGMGTGIVAGMAIATTSTVLMKSNKHAKRKVGSALKTVGNIVENVSYMMK